MPIGVVSSDDFESEIDKSKSSPVQIPKVIPVRGRGIGNIGVPDSLRKIIGETSEIDGRQSALEIASKFGISDSSVSAYANGATSTASYGQSKSSIRDHINKTKERISKKARQKLGLALDGITAEKLLNAKVKDASGVARDMAAIIKDMEPDLGPQKNPNAPQFIFYSPQFKEEKHFETIIVKE